ncbi:hypothetical protein AMK27_36675 [Streptomyces sp. CB02009]|nr:hypothetical protein AMK27_36675 [Streptomyces sp. CB02009]
MSAVGFDGVGVEVLAAGFPLLPVLDGQDAVGSGGGQVKAGHQGAAVREDRGGGAGEDRRRSCGSFDTPIFTIGMPRVPIT